ncbi:hypothetical protein D9611_009117 [Ephemerocybe angulata]|uniref:RRM domain-containing protein n=1 Tax=Ephemerocybe angulata TaxID=980116 RepID=A0A8H5FK44_9AGAR|nr:hypothetical protein D9611_009117 [Tulosesus angulatus]
MASNLGKRKEREADDAHGSTLFVSNLPYTATSVDLETLFSDIAPVRTAFVVTEHGTGVSKGVGYVSFALKEDAEACFKQVSEEGLLIAHRKIRIQWADKKPLQKRNADDAEPTQKREQPKRPREPLTKTPQTPHDPLAVKTLIVAGLPTPLEPNVLWKKIRKCAGADKLIYPAKDVSGEDDPTQAHVVFSTAAKASDAVAKLHAHVYKGSLLSATLKKRVEALAKPKKAKTAAAAPAIAPNRASRLIVRNLPFTATEQDLRALFLPYGPIHSITLPKAEPKEQPPQVKDAEEDDAMDEDGENENSVPTPAHQPRNKGFAFVWMLSKQDASRALEGCNGKPIRAGMAQDLVSAKQKRKKQLRLERKMKGVSLKEKEGEGEGEGDEEGEEKEDENETEKEEEEKEEDEEEDEHKEATERVIAVDWALSKEKWKEEVAKMEEVKVDSDIDMDSDSASSSSNSDSEDEDEAIGVHEDDSDDGSSQDDSDSDSDYDRDRDEDEDEPTKPALPAPEAGTTLFVRNVPYIATEEELRTLFRAYGPLRYARITMDGSTGRSRGTGFACFWNKEDADKVIEQSEVLRTETTGLSTAPKKNPFSLPSILTPDPSSSLARSLVLHGRTLDVVRAVTRETATKLREEGEKLREKQDKRNMYLLREGLIHPNSPAAASLSPAEIERRTASYNSRRTLLKSNPALFISRTRLSIRQVPLYVSERMLKRLAVHAVRAFNKEVKAGEREGLSADEVAERSEDGLADILNQGLKEAGENVPAKDDGKKTAAKGKGRDTGVKQTKIVRQNERIDPLTAKGRSKGYGFIEMNTHADALRVLRWANNNPAVTPLFRAWYKEELSDYLKREKSKPAEERDEARIKRIKEEVDGSGGGATARGGDKDRGTLIVEFSIENVMVVQRRAQAAAGGAKRDREAAKGGKEDVEGQAPGGTKRSNREREGGERERESGPPSKRRKTDGKGGKEKEKGGKSGKGEKAQSVAKDESASKKKKDEEHKKPFNPVGAVIGRKRKEKKMGKKK